MMPISMMLLISSMGSDMMRFSTRFARARVVTGIVVEVPALTWATQGRQVEGWASMRLDAFC